MAIQKFIENIIRSIRKSGLKPKIIVYKRDLAFFSFLFLLIVLLIFYGFSKVEGLENKFSIPEGIVMNITLMQITISLISITIMELFLISVDERIMGITYKNIFFKKGFFGFFHLVNCIYFMLLLMCFSIFASAILMNITYNASHVLGQIIILVALTISIFFIFHMIKMGLISKYKKSILYSILYKRLEQENMQIYHKIAVWLDIKEELASKYNSYILEEMIVLSYVFVHIDKFERNSVARRKRITTIIFKMQQLIESDPRDPYSLFDIISKELEKRFGKENANKIFHCFKGDKYWVPSDACPKICISHRCPSLRSNCFPGSIRKEFH